MTQSASGAEAAAQLVAHAGTEIRPVEQAEAASRSFQHGRDDLDRTQDAQSAAAVQRRAKQARAATADADSPQDRAVFRAKVIRFLQSIYAEDMSFQRALERGTIIIRAVEDMPDPDLRPEIAYATYRQGAMQTGQALVELDPPGAARAAPQSVGASDFVACWPK